MSPIGIYFVFSVLCTLVAANTDTSGDIQREDGVLVLTTSNFDDAIKQHENLLVEFYAPWCGHCKALAPEFAKAAQLLSDEASDIQLAKVDATVESDLGTKYDVRGYPSLKFFRNGKDSEYNGPRKAEGIVQWLKKKTSFPAIKILSPEEAKHFVDSHDVAVLGYFAAEDSEAAKSYLENVRLDDELEYGFTTDASVLAEYGVDPGQDGKIILLKKFDEPRTEYAGEWSAASIGRWVRSNALPMFIEFSQDSAQRIFAGDIKHHLLLFAHRADEAFQKMNDTMRELAKTFRDKALMVFIDTEKEDNSRIAEFFGLSSKQDYPSVRLINLNENLIKYKPEKVDFGFDYLKSFVQDVFDEKIKPHLMTQDVPSDWDAKPVKVLVGKNFDEIVFNDKSKDVLVEFYAPWCGHCKKLAPIYDELAEKYAANDKYVIAKLDATVNELPHTQVQSFPTIRLYKAGSRDFVEYNGERTLDGLSKFLDTDGEYGRAAPDDAEYDGEEDDEEGDDEEEDHDVKDHKHVEL